MPFNPEDRHTVGSINFGPGYPTWVIPLPDPSPPIDRGTPHKCPICCGEGSIPAPKECTAAEVVCPTCHGERVLWSKVYPQSTTSTGTGAMELSAMEDFWPVKYTVTGLPADKEGGTE